MHTGIVPEGIDRLLAWVGNLTGALLAGQQWGLVRISPAAHDPLGEIVARKTVAAEVGGAGAWLAVVVGAGAWLSVVVSGFLANWLVGMAAFFATMGRTIIGKYIPVVLAVTAFVAAGFQHSPVNKGVLLLGRRLRAASRTGQRPWVEPAARRDRQYPRRRFRGGGIVGLGLRPLPGSTRGHPATVTGTTLPRAPRQRGWQAGPAATPRVSGVGGRTTPALRGTPTARGAPSRTGVVTGACTVTRGPPVSWTSTAR